MKKRKMVVTTILLVVVSFLATTLISIHSLQGATNDNDSFMAKLLASNIYDAINNELIKPIMVSRTMANDHFLTQSLKEEAQISEQEMVDQMSEYLDELKNSLGYDTAFVISDQSYRYYSYDGLNKIITPDEGHDIWYSDFMEKGYGYDLDVDKDEVNGNRWTIFVNSRIEDENGHYLGVCGVGVKMNNIQKMLQSYEKEYGIKINLVEANGLVQVDTENINIENANLYDELQSSGLGKEPYTYARQGVNGYLVTRYIENLDWYLIIQNGGTDEHHILSGLVWKNTVVFAAILAFLIFCIRGILIRENRELEESACTDKLTGVANRNFFRYHLNEKKLQEKYKALAIFDIDFFKTVNDTRGHSEGDVILKRVAEICAGTIGTQGDVIRWGGDEFLILFQTTVEEAFLLCEQFRIRVEKETYVTVSVGIVKLQEEENLEQGIDRADMILYEAKKQGRNRVSGE